MVSIARWAIIGLGVIFAGLFIKRSAETSIGQASQEIAGAFGTFGQSLGSVGSGLGSLGIGFRNFITNTLDPFNLRSLIGDAIRPSGATTSADRVVVLNQGDANSGNTGGFNVVQSTKESTPTNTFADMWSKQWA